MLLLPPFLRSRSLPSAQKKGIQTQRCSPPRRRPSKHHCARACRETFLRLDSEISPLPLEPPPLSCTLDAEWSRV